WAVRIAVLWLAALLGLALFARQTFDVPLGDVGDFLGTSADVGFETAVAPTLFLGLVWLAGVLVLALLVSRGAPLPARLLRFQESVRPAAYAMVGLLLACLGIGLVIAAVVALTRGHAAQTAALVLLGLPNVVWPAFTIGLGATWDSQVEGPFGLPMPKILDEVVRGPDVSTLNLGSLADYDGRVWWLPAVNAVLLVLASFVMAARSPARVRLWQHAVHMAAGLAATVLMICLVGRISAHYGLSVLGIGDLGGDLGGELFLRPHLWSALGLAVLWGLVTGFLGAALARRVGRRGEVEEGASRR
ncbi:streptophobe family protein, partial [Streptomyces scabiei]|uniref:streptophobe family protein n=1 Tax=Streptomyces scabiei TaxID=1930 RepID=UPI000765E4F0